MKRRWLFENCEEMNEQYQVFNGRRQSCEAFPQILVFPVKGPNNQRSEWKLVVEFSATLLGYYCLYHQAVSLLASIIFFLSRIRTSCANRTKSQREHELHQIHHLLFDVNHCCRFNHSKNITNINDTSCNKTCRR